MRTKILSIIFFNDSIKSNKFHCDKITKFNPSLLAPVWRNFFALASLSSLFQERKTSTKDLKDSGRASTSSPSPTKQKQCTVHVRYTMKSMKGNICQTVAIIRGGERDTCAGRQMVWRRFQSFPDKK